MLNSGHRTILYVEVKAALIERFNRTMKTRMYIYFTANNTLKYIDILPHLVDGNNRTVHRYIGMAPADVQSNHVMQLRQKLYGTKNQSVKKYKYRVGDFVRISNAKRTFKKGRLSSKNFFFYFILFINIKTLGIQS